MSKSLTEYRYLIYRSNLTILGEKLYESKDFIIFVVSELPIEAVKMLSTERD